MIAINNNQIQSMLEQLRATASKAAPPLNHIEKALQRKTEDSVGEPSKADFASTLKNALDSVNELQVKSEKLGEQFAAGDDSVQLSDVMISMQKASVALQTTVQARNRLVSAYQEIMGMQV
ncbi:MAG: flagellar hook-basal body complex protein FliE [Burkholderiaceae bacterium]|nr:flagellar hook-basal body complex protein FliE [Burkholderiaceae bacterium]